MVLKFETYKRPVNEIEKGHMFVLHVAALKPNDIVNGEHLES